MLTFQVPKEVWKMLRRAHLSATQLFLVWEDVTAAMILTNYLVSLRLAGLVTILAKKA